MISSDRIHNNLFSWICYLITELNLCVLNVYLMLKVSHFVMLAAILHNSSNYCATNSSVFIFYGSKLK